MGVQLFGQPVVGVADNTDFYRMSVPVGVCPVAYSNAFRYMTLRFAFGPAQKVEYLSSELLFCQAAHSINRTFVSQTFFDIRSLGLIHTVVYSLALLAFACGLQIPGVPKLIFLFACFFLLLDVRITAYFNSFYSESASVIFLVFTVAAMLFVQPQRSTWFQSGVGWAAFLICAFGLAFSKTQHLILLLPLWGFGVCSIWKKISAASIRWGWILATALLMMGSFYEGLVSRAYAATKGTNVQIVLRDEIKPHSADYAADLLEMHATPDDTSRVNLAHITLFWAKHPIRFYELLERRAAKAFAHFPYGNYTRADAHGPMAQSAKFNVLWQFKTHYYPKRLWFIMGLLTGGLLIGAWCHVQRITPWQAHVGLITATLAVMAACAFLVAAAFEANGPEKHLFLFNVIFDLVTAFSVLLISARVVPWIMQAALRPRHEPSNE